MPAAVETHDLCKRYGSRWALAHLDLEVPEGQRLLVVGQNGSGKTTLLRVLATATAPTRGELRLYGRNPAQDLLSARRDLALVTHLPGLYEDLCARENLGITARLMGRPDQSARWLQAVELEDRPDPVRGYSAGMRKRLSFARLLAQAPRLALLDEPYGQLDPAGFVFVERLMEELRAGGATVIMVSHHVERAGLFCDRALLLHEGLLRWQGPAAQALGAWSALHGQDRTPQGAQP